MRALLAAGPPACQVNPFRLRQFAKASGILAKSDRLDAQVIASFIAIMPTRRARRHLLAIERLTEKLTVRRQLSDEKVAAQIASAMLENAMLLRLSRRRIARLAADIDLLDTNLIEIVRTDAALVMRKMTTMLNAMVRDDVAWAHHLHGRSSVRTAR